MERQTKILDASIIVKWFSEEKDSEKAVILRDKHAQKEINIAISQITTLEVLNALRYKKKNEEELKKANEDIENMQLLILPTDPVILNKSIELSLKHNLTLYDALYLSLAEFYNLSLITEDSAFINLKNVTMLEKI
mgnify:CR=1 FL=1